MSQIIVRPSDIKQAVGLSKSLAYAKLDPKSPKHDATFPRPVKLAGNAVGWRLDELQQWVAALPRSGGA